MCSSANSRNGSSGSSRWQGWYTLSQHHVHGRALKRTSHMACLGLGLARTLFGRVVGDLYPLRLVAARASAASALGLTNTAYSQSRLRGLGSRAAHRSAQCRTAVAPRDAAREKRMMARWASPTSCARSREQTAFSSALAIDQTVPTCPRSGTGRALSRCCKSGA